MKKISHISQETLVDFTSWIEDLPLKKILLSLDGSDRQT